MNAEDGRLRGIERICGLPCQRTFAAILGKTPPASGYDTAICDLMADVFDFLMRRARSSPSEGASAAGGPLAGLTTDELAFFHAGLATFQAAEGIGDGLWPQFNLDSRSGCHSQPGIGGSSPAVNPQRNIGVADGAHNKVPSFVHPNGPIVEARFKIQMAVSGRKDNTGNASACTAVQDDFNTQ